MSLEPVSLVSETKEGPGVGESVTDAVEDSPFPFLGAARAKRSCCRLRLRPFPNVNTVFLLPSDMVNNAELR